jgi:hypothetical protein
MKIVKLIMALFPLFSWATDLTIIGYMNPENGIGKIGINISSTLDDDVSINLISMSSIDPLPEYFIERLSSDTSPGNVSILTHPLSFNFIEFYSFVPSESIIKIAYSMLETDKIPDSWVKILNENFDSVVVPDKYLLGVYEKCGVIIPIFVLPIPMDLQPYYSSKKHSYSHSKPFVFGDASANKNPIKLIESFNLAFGNTPDVQLHLRSGWKCINPEIIENKINELGLKNVFFEFGYLNQLEYIKKLQSYDCYANLSRGEGFSFIQRECLSLGIPIICTNNTALKTLCNIGFVKSIPCDKLGTPNEFYLTTFHEDVGYQFDCKIKDVAKAMLDVYQNYKKYVKLAREGRKWVKKYDIHNHTLRRKYRNLVKPDKLFLGDKNVITEDFIMTSSKELYNKYLQIKN